MCSQIYMPDFSILLIHDAVFVYRNFSKFSKKILVTKMTTKMLKNSLHFFPQKTLADKNVSVRHRS